MKKKRGAAAGEILDLPPDALCDMASVSIMGTREAVIENFKSVIDYSDNSVRVMSPEGIIRIYGEELCLNAVTDESVTVSGKIAGVEME